ncbi:MAG: ATP-binding protein [Pseudomonadota bacterium]
MSADAEPWGREPVSDRWRTILLVVTAALGAAVLTLLVVTLGEATRQRDRALAAQSHSYEVMILARTLSGTIARAEASLGRYVISADRSLGVTYSQQWSLAGNQIERLAAVTADNPEQHARMDELRDAYEARGAELAATALSTRYGKNDQALARYYKARKGDTLVQIDALLDDVIVREREVLRARTGDAMAGVARSNQSVKVLIVFGVLIVLAAIALGWATMAALRERADAQAEADSERERNETLEAAVAAATEELRIEARERADAEAQLRQAQKMDAVGQLTGGIAHDFNNMLAVVLGGLELARRHAGEGAALRHIDNATEGANRAAALTKRLLAFARAEPLLPEAIDPANLIGEMSNLLDRTLGGTVKVRARDDGAAWLVWADRHQLENAILNLAVNARDAMEGKGTLTVATGAMSLATREVGECAAGDYVTIAVSDTGCGIAPEMIERVFEPFFTTKPVGHGTGLGLSQIFAFVRQSTGEVAIASAPGTGTTVTLYLPRHIAAPVMVPADVVAVPAPRSDPQAGLAILVVEDDPRVLTATIGALAELGHRPVECADPLHAPECLAAMASVDLILSDVLMPGRTGPEMIAALPAVWMNVPVLFVTGYAGELDRDGFGGHPVLRKPFTLAALERAVGDAVAACSDGTRAAA